MDILLIMVLILLNGIFAMSEIAIVSSRKARLQKFASEQRKGAKVAVALHNEPAHFFSTIQVGITSVGILSGAIGENALTGPLQAMLIRIPLLAPYAQGIALTLTVIIITYLSVVIGELVPKRLAMRSPEAIALVVARPMAWLAKIANPLVWLLSASSNFLLWVLRLHRHEESSVTNEEIKMMMQQGSEAGVFHESEEQIVANVLKLDEQRVGAVMTHYKDVVFIDLHDTEEAILATIIQCHYSQVVVCRDGLENAVGILQRSDLLKPALNGLPLDIEAIMRAPLYIPDVMPIPYLLDNFRKARTQFAIIVDEYGQMKGIVTLNDVLSAIVGDFPTTESNADPDVIQRDDGSWLVDGEISLARLKSIVNIDTNFPGEQSHIYNTLAGFIMTYLERIPTVAEYFDYSGWRYEIVDINHARIAKVLLMRSN